MQNVLLQTAGGGREKGWQAITVDIIIFSRVQVVEKQNSSDILMVCSDSSKKFKKKEFLCTI